MMDGTQKEAEGTEDSTSQFPQAPHPGSAPASRLTSSSS